MKLPSMTEQQNKDALRSRQDTYRDLIKNQIHKCSDSISSIHFKEQVEEIVHEMKVLRRRLGYSSSGDKWLHEIVYGGK